MNFFSGFLLTAVVFCVMVNIAATGRPRNKRSVAFLMCPEDKTVEQCLEDQRRENAGCNQYVANGRIIEIQSCGSVNCGDEGQLVQGDSKLPYPDCCAKCAPKSLPKLDLP